jgi:hypothetical protein
MNWHCTNYRDIRAFRFQWRRTFIQWTLFHRSCAITWY